MRRCTLIYRKTLLSSVIKTQGMVEQSCIAEFLSYLSSFFRIFRWNFLATHTILFYDMTINDALLWRLAEFLKAFPKILFSKGWENGQEININDKNFKLS